MPNRGTQQPDKGRNPGVQAPPEDDDAVEIDEPGEEDELGAQAGKRRQRQDDESPDDATNVESDETEEDGEEEDGSGGHV